MTSKDRADAIHVTADELNKLIAEACVDNPNIKVTVEVVDIRTAVRDHGTPHVRVEVAVVI